MNQHEIDDLYRIRAALEDKWWSCTTIEAEDFLNGLIDRVDTKLREVEAK